MAPAGVERHPGGMASREGFDLAAAVDDDVLLLLWSVRLGRLLDGLLSTVLRQHGLDVSQASVLLTLLLSGRRSPTDLRRILVQTSGGMTKTIDRLATAGLVARSADPADGRGTLVSLTRRGSNVARTSFDALAAAWRDVIAEVPSPRRRSLLASTRTLLSALEAATGATSTA